MLDILSKFRVLQLKKLPSWEIAVWRSRLHVAKAPGEAIPFGAGMSPNFLCPVVQ